MLAIGIMILIMILHRVMQLYPSEEAASAMYATLLDEAKAKARKVNFAVKPPETAATGAALPTGNLTDEELLAMPGTSVPLSTILYQQPDHWSAIMANCALFSLAHNQKHGVIVALLNRSDWSTAEIMLKNLKATMPSLQPEIRKALCDRLHQVVQPLYKEYVCHCHCCAIWYRIILTCVCVCVCACCVSDCSSKYLAFINHPIIVLVTT
jgi:hypothetical protein